MNEEQLRSVCKQLHIHADNTMGKGKLIDAIFGEKCEKNYVQPTFIIDYPVEMSPLTKKHRDKQGLVERFELMINGKEIANAYSELNDPIDQRERFEEQVKLRNGAMMKPCSLIMIFSGHWNMVCRLHQVLVLVLTGSVCY